MTRPPPDHRRLYSPEWVCADTLRQFRDIVAGKTRTKPKYLMNPKSGELHRLILPESGQRPFYAELPLESGTIYHMALTKSAIEKARVSEPPTLPEGYSIHTFRSEHAEPLGLTLIHLPQMHIILNALGRSYRWSIAEFANADDAARPYIANVLYHGNRIVGLCAWDQSRLLHKPPIAGISLFLLAPDERSSGLGSTLLSHTHQQALAMGAECIVLSTSSSCTDKDGTCITDFYKHQGYALTKQYPFTYEQYKQEPSDRPITVPEEFFRNPKTGEELPRFQKARLDEQLLRVSRELLPMGRSR